MIPFFFDSGWHNRSVTTKIILHQDIIITIGTYYGVAKQRYSSLLVFSLPSCFVSPFFMLPFYYTCIPIFTYHLQLFESSCSCALVPSVSHS